MMKMWREVIKRERSEGKLMGEIEEGVRAAWLKTDRWGKVQSMFNMTPAPHVLHASVPTPPANIPNNPTASAIHTPGVIPIVGSAPFPLNGTYDGLALATPFTS
jgi:hypothetical protein